MGKKSKQHTGEKCDLKKRARHYCVTHDVYWDEPGTPTECPVARGESEE